MITLALATRGEARSWQVSFVRIAACARRTFGRLEKVDV